MENFSTAKPLKSVFEIPSSMKVHYVIMNGRTVAHALDQIFMLMPKFVFNIANAAVFVLMLVCINRMTSKEYNCTVLIGSFSMIMIFAKAFGQACLWMTGSCNYLWGVTFSLLMVLCYKKSADAGFDISLYKKVLLFLLSFLAGGYSENASAAAIAITFFILCAEWIFYKNKPKLIFILSWLAACANYLLMAISPKEVSGKVNIGNILAGLKRAHVRYMDNVILIAAFFIFLVLAIALKADTKKILFSLALLFGSLLSNYMMCFATYYEYRSAFCPLVYLVAAICVLIDTVFYDKLMWVLVGLTVITSVFAASTCLDAAINVRYDYFRVKANEEIIYEAVRDGKDSVEIPNIHTDCPYSPLWDIKYIDVEDYTSWPNDSMTLYYGINEIHGY